jgi:hypothetical protein
MSRRYRPIALLLASLIPSLALAFPDGPPDGVTGAPGEMTCAQVDCHGNLNEGDGFLNIVGPITYVRGDTIDISVELGQDGQQMWGFELTVLDGNGQPVGEIFVTDPVRTQASLDTASGRSYIKHTLVGTDFGVPDVAPGWSLKWISPSSGGGHVTFYAAGNAANGNGSFGSIRTGRTRSTRPRPFAMPCPRAGRSPFESSM